MAEAVTTKPGSNRDYRGPIQSFLWRTSAAVVWLWLVGYLASPDSYIGRFHSIALWQLSSGIVLAMVLYVGVKREHGMGCAAAVFLLPFYILLWPLILFAYVIIGVISLLTGTAKRTQHLVWSLVPYGITVAAFAVSTTEFVAHWQALTILLCFASGSFVILSLITWVFQPLSWVSGALSLYFGLTVKNATRTQIPDLADLIQGDNKAHENLKAAAKSLLSAHTNLGKAPRNFEQIFQDALIAGAFARKFVVSLIHVGFLFALSHHALNVGTTPPGVAYQGLSAAPFAGTWFDYSYFGLMTLVTGEANAIPISTAARVATLLNAYTGVGFLVILVTTFSMVTRDRARLAVRNMVARASSVDEQIERDIVAAVLIAAISGALTDDLLAEFGRVDKFRALDSSDEAVFRGALLLQKIIRLLEHAGRTTDLAEALQARKIFITAEFAALSLALTSVDSTNLDGAVHVVRSLLQQAQARSTEAPE